MTWPWKQSNTSREGGPGVEAPSTIEIVNRHLETAPVGLYQMASALDLSATTTADRRLPRGVVGGLALASEARVLPSLKEGEEVRIDGNFDNSDLVEGKMPLELFHGPEEAAAQRRKPGM